MSSDLWAAFGGGDSEDMDSNPWTQSSSEPVAASKDSVSRLGNDIASINIRNAASIELGAVQTGSKDHDSDVDSWSAVNQELEDAWTDTAALKQSHPQALQPQPLALASSVDEDDFGDFEGPNVWSTPAKHRPQETLFRNQEHGTSTIEVDDDFGDFEDAETEAQTTGTETVNPAQQATVGGIDGINQSENEQNPLACATQATSDAHIDHDPLAELEGLSKPKPLPKATAIQAAILTQVKPISTKATNPKSIAPASKTVSAIEADPFVEWDDFSEPVSQPVSTTRPLSSKPVKASPDPVPKEIPATRSTAQASDALPPTNVPPPSMLMPLVSAIIQDLPGEIETILQSHEDYKGGKSALTQALGVLTALEDRVNVIKVAARILAGRKLRWKRDTILAQSMSIGTAGRQGGMKLVGVDKTEVKREDREAAEFVRIWGRNQGRVRSALMKLPAQIDEKPPALPQIAESMPIRTLKDTQGGIRSPKGCVVCGLKREERVEKVDLDVWDQFGEWWTEHWGHTECRTFWNTHEQFLQQR
jgi:hypothetical protein